jgi:hypothetical protein
MDKLIEFYKQCIKQVLSDYQSLNTDWSNIELLFDDERKHYMVLRIGWFKHQRVHLCLVHIDIIDEKIVIQVNNTEDLIDSMLIETGIPREDICLGILPPEVRDS